MSTLHDAPKGRGETAALLVRNGSCAPWCVVPWPITWPGQACRWRLWMARDLTRPTWPPRRLQCQHRRGTCTRAGRTHNPQLRSRGQMRGSGAELGLRLCQSRTTCTIQMGWWQAATRAVERWHKKHEFVWPAGRPFDARKIANWAQTVATEIGKAAQCGHRVGPDCKKCYARIDLLGYSRGGHARFELGGDPGDMKADLPCAMAPVFLGNKELPVKRTLPRLSRASGTHPGSGVISRR